MADMGLTRNLCKRPRSPEHSSIGQDYAPRDEVVTGQDLRAGKFAKNVDEEEVVSEDPYGTNEPEEAEESQNGVEQPTDGPEDSHAQQPTDVPEGSEVLSPQMLQRRQGATLLPRLYTCRQVLWSVSPGWLEQLT